MRQLTTINTILPDTSTPKTLTAVSLCLLAHRSVHQTQQTTVMSIYFIKYSCLLTPIGLLMPALLSARHCIQFKISTLIVIGWRWAISNLILASVVLTALSFMSQKRRILAFPVVTHFPARRMKAVTTAIEISLFKGSPAATILTRTEVLFLMSLNVVMGGHGTMKAHCPEAQMVSTKTLWVALGHHTVPRTIRKPWS